MSIVQGQTTSFKYQLFEGVHNFLTNSFYMALYTGYTTTGEISGTGYTAGGKLLTGTTVNYDAANSVAYVNFNNVVWSPATFTARCALIYNASAGNASVAVIDFGSDKSCSSTFTVTMPSNTYSTALIRSS